MISQFAPRTRREVLAGLASAALASLAARDSAYNPKLAAQTYVWLLEMQSRNKPLADGLEEICAGMHRAGYRRVELMPEFVEPRVRDKALDLFRKYKLEPAIVYASGPLHERNAAETTRKQILDTARAMKDAGTGFVNFSAAPKPGEQRKADEELQTQAYQLNRMGRELQDAGLRLLLHHHVAEMRDGAREWRYCLSHTEAPLVSFCVDVDWAARAGMNPVDVMEEAGGRLGSLHLRNSRNGRPMEELGDGDIDMSRIAAYLRQVFYQGFLVVELLYDKDTKRTHSLPTALSLSRMYMQKLFGTRPGSMPVDMGPHVRTKET